MKLSHVRKLVKSLSNIPLQEMSSEERKKTLSTLGIDLENFYQEMEMDYPLVQTHEDISQSEDVVGLHSHTYYEIIFVRSGNLQYLLGTKRYRLKRGDILVIAPGVSHQPLFLEKLIEPYDRYVLWLSTDFAKMAKTYLEDVKDATIVTPLLRTSTLPNDATANFEKMFRKGVKEASNAGPGWQSAVLCNTLSILVAMYQNFYNQEVPLPTPEKQELMDEIVAYVEANLSNPISIKSTAHHFLVSESTVSQLFSKRLGVSYYRFVTQRRLIAAKDLILNDEPLTDIAGKVGFKDYSSFYRAFKSQFGITPKEFKNYK